VVTQIFDFTNTQGLTKTRHTKWVVFFGGVLIIVNKIQISKGETFSPLLNDRCCSYPKYVCNGLLGAIAQQ
jgi:hypothetical protein